MLAALSLSRVRSVSLYALLGVLLLENSAAAQDGAPTINSGDTAWILVATALVLFMNIPGLALFYGGLVRSKNVLSLLMQCLALTAVISLLWMVCGYSLAFSTVGMSKGEIGLHSFIGGLDKCFFAGITAESVSGSIPEILFAAYQMTFAVITPALIIGAFTERMKFSAVLLFSSLWLLVVYVPICHMTWSGDGAYFYDLGVKDFAGGIVVHITAGFAALVACVLVGPRAGYPQQLQPPHNMTMTVTGTAMLWVGWYGFNAGSALKANGDAAMALMVTHISACAATVVWMAIEWIKLRKPSVLGAATGSVAGLAAVTPASGYIGPIGALMIGATAAAVCYLFATTIKRRVGYDDSLDVFGVHGVGGFWGTVLAGVFCAGMFGGKSGDVNILSQLGIQFGAAAGSAVFALIASYLLLKIIDATIGLRVSGQSEFEGLDLAEHGERGYNY